MPGCPASRAHGGRGRWSWRRLAALTLIVLAAGAARGEALDLEELTTPVFTAFSARDGLPPSVLVSIAVDTEGFVWASSPHGLARYDGRRWTTDPAVAPAGAGGQLLRRADGSLVVAFADRRVAQLVAGRWVFEPVPAPQHILRLAETRAHAAAEPDEWALTTGSGLWHRGPDGWAPEAAAAGGPPRQLRSLVATQRLGGAARLWVGSRDTGLWYRTGTTGRWHQLRAPGFADVQINDLLVTHEDGGEQLWIGTYGAGLWRLDEHGLQRWTGGDAALRDASIYALEQGSDAHGRAIVWAASRSGLLRIRGERVRALTRADGLPADAVRDLFLWEAPDGSQVLWLATEEGVARSIVDAGGWRVVLRAGLRNSGVFPVLVEPDAGAGERLWAGTAGEGLLMYHLGRWQPVALPGMRADSTVRLLKRLPGADGREVLWVATTGGGLFHRRRDGSFARLRGPWPDTSTEAVVDLAQRRVDGVEELWAATRTSGLYRRREGRWEAVRVDGIPDRPWSAWGLASQRDASGREWLWASGSEGLLRHDGERLEKVAGGAMEAPAPLFSVTAVERAGRVELWLGGQGAVRRVDVTDPRAPRWLADELPPPPDPTVYGAWPDGHGRFWVCTDAGVQLLQRDGAAWTSRVFTRVDGLPADECNLNGQFVDRAQRFWVGTMGGVGVYDPAADNEDRHPKPLRLTGLRIEGVVQDSGTRHVALTATQRRLSVDYALLSWREEDQDEFRAYMIGLDAEPPAWSRETGRRFERVPPGSYLLRIEARDHAGNESVPIEITVEVQPRWWQTWQAATLGAIGVLLLLWALVQWRLGNLRARHDRLRREVRMRTRELHDANERLQEMARRDPLTRLANHGHFEAVLRAAVQPGAERESALLFLDVDRFKAYNDFHGHPAGDEALRAVAAVLRELTPVGALAARYGGEEFTCFLPGGDLAGARALGERIRLAVAQRPIPLPGSDATAHVTISIGVAARVLGTGQDVNALVREADAALYCAKAEGRDRVYG